MSIIRNSLAIILWVTVTIACAAPALQISEGLVFKLSDHQRRAVLAVDPIEEQLVAGRFTPPVAGQKVQVAPGESAAWQVARADSMGWFSDAALRGGWFYCKITLKTAGAYLLEGMGHNMAYVNGVPRIGNRYRAKDNFEPWEPRFDYGLVPVLLNRGDNHLLIRSSRGRLKILLHTTAKPALFNSKDVTLPDLLQGESLQSWAAIPVLNATDAPLNGLFLRGRGDGVRIPEIALPPLLPQSLRKAAFKIEAAAVQTVGAVKVELTLFRRGADMPEEILEQTEVTLQRVAPEANHRRTFVSTIDGSVQYYAVNPASTTDETRKVALFLSLHGANVEGFNQAGSYAAKSWGHIVAPTNRRPYGHNWEDWGRLDAVEVLALAKSTLAIDTSRIYLTGHSMGGHGTWIFSATYPDQFAAIGPSAGWISFWSYGVRESAADSIPVRRLFQRAANVSNTLALVPNYQQHGIYIIHGAADDNVPVKQAYLMIDSLKNIHKDYVFHEEPGAGHWWDHSDEPGADCVDWPPLFDFFARHGRAGAERLRQIDFTTANPGVSARCDWLTVVAQEHPLEFSRVKILLDPGQKRFTGTTENVAVLALRPPQDAGNQDFKIQLDGDSLAMPLQPTLWLERRDGHWQPGAAVVTSQKGPHRYGPFKEAFHHRMIFVYGTRGSKEERNWAVQKARYDAESFWYQSNGSVDVISDQEFDLQKNRDRSVVLYGNAHTNSAWNQLLKTSPIQVQPGAVRIGGRIFRGDDLACLFVYPRQDSETASVAVVSGSGVQGMRLTTNLPYLYAGSAFPDFSLFNSEILRTPGAGLLAAGYFDRFWRLTDANIAFE